MTSRKKPGQTALSAFLTNLTEIERLLTRLQEAASDHFDTHPDELHWGHVGSLGKLRDDLQSASNFIFNEGE